MKALTLRCIETVLRQYLRLISQYCKFMGITVWMVFEAIAAKKEAVEESLDDHLEKLESESEVEIKLSNIDDVSKIEKPHPELEEGYSQVAECQVEVESFKKCIQITFDYGPTYVQVEGPEEYEMDLKEGQESLQQVADVMHSYAQKGLGGVLVSKPTEEQ